MTIEEIVKQEQPQGEEAVTEEETANEVVESEEGKVEESKKETAEEEKTPRNRRTKAQIEAEKEWQETDLTQAYAEEIADLYKAPPELLEEFKAFAVEKGFTASQAKELINLQAQMVQKQEAMFEQQLLKETEATREALQKEWGQEFDSNMRAIKGFIEDKASPEVQDLIITAFGSNKEVLNFFKDVALERKEPAFIDGKSAPIGSFATARDEWNNACNEIPAYRQALSQYNHPLHDEAQRKWTSIMNKHEAIRIKNLQS